MSEITLYIGVDAAVGRTGVVVGAEGDDHALTCSGRVFTSRRSDPGRLVEISSNVSGMAHDAAYDAANDGDSVAALLAIEGLGQAIGNQRINYGLHWMIRSALAAKIPYLSTLVVAPMSLKVFCVGRGGAGVGKSTVAGIMDRWPDQVNALRDETGELPAEDVLEALGLMMVARCWARPDLLEWTDKQRDVARLESLTGKKRRPREVYEDGLSMRLDEQPVGRRGVA
jgi:hypothetical protein